MCAHLVTANNVEKEYASTLRETYSSGLCNSDIIHTWPNALKVITVREIYTV